MAGTSLSAPRWVNVLPGLPAAASFGSTGGLGSPINVNKLTNRAYFLNGTSVSAISGGVFYNVADYGAVGDGTTDNSTSLQNAINAAGLTGGTLYFPPGVFLFSTTLVLKNKVRYLGSGNDTAALLGTVLKYTGASDAVQINNPSNGSTNANIAIEYLTIFSVTRTAKKACLADNGSSQLKIRNCSFGGADRLLILDQTEEGDVIDCDFECPASSSAAIWLVNGADRTVGNSPGFTNRIGIKQCQINGPSSAIGILDDGGNTHAFVDNNYNGFLHSIRAAGVSVIRVEGGEFESATGAITVYDSTTFDAARATGGCGSLLILNGEYSPTSGQACVNFAGATAPVIIIGPFFNTTSSAKVTGTANCDSLFAMGISPGSGGATFDAMATNHWEVGNNGAGAITITTNLTALNAFYDGSYIRAHGGAIPSTGFGLELIHNGTAGAGGTASIVAYDRGASVWQSLQIGAAGIALQISGSTLAGLDSAGFNLTGISYKVGGTQVVTSRQAAVTAPTGGTTIDTQARTAINDLISRLQAHGLIS